MLPTKTTDSPIIGYKAAFIVHNDNSTPVHLQGLSSTMYDPVDVTSCLCPNMNKYPICPTNNPYHHCGFHAYKTYEMLMKGISNPTTILLVQMKVELSGIVVAHQNGYRASQQRVLGIYRPNNHICDRFYNVESCNSPADGYIKSSSINFVNRRWAYMHNICLDHFPSDRHVYTIKEICAQLDVPLLEEEP